MDLPIRRLLQPRSLEEALQWLEEIPDARAVAGGTDLVVQLRDGRRKAAAVVDLGRLDLAGIREGDTGVEIGALTPMDTLARDGRIADGWPALAQAASLVGAWPIQCRATIGGNLANASPAADTAPPLLVADAALRLVSRRGQRTIPLRGFFRGPGQTLLEPGELIAAVWLPRPPSEAGARAFERFVKVGPRREQIISVVSVALRVVLVDGVIRRAAVALGAVAPTPVRAGTVEAYLEGQRSSAAVRQRAAALLQQDIAPIDDVRAPAAYRRVAAAVVLDRLLEEAGDA